MINYGATYGVGFLLSLYLQYIRGFSAETAGLILVAQPLVQTILSPVAGKISDRVEPQVVATIGMAITTLGLSFFIFLAPDTSLLMIIAALMILGFGYYVFLLAQHQRDYELSGQALSRHRVRHGGNDAVAGTGAFDGDRDVLLHDLHRHGHDYPRGLPGPP
jgi:MFS family permease